MFPNMNFAFINRYNSGLNLKKKTFHIVYRLRTVVIRKYNPIFQTIYE